jgi:deoxyhypusine monooxygenase
MNDKSIDLIENVEELGNILGNDSLDIKKRMNALFQLRTVGTFKAIKALENALITEKSSDLIRHEVCYCFGQMIETEENKKEIEDFLNKEIFADPKKYNPIVLHEAAEALGNIDSDYNIKLLERFIDYEDDIIKETCEISVENLNWMLKTNHGETEGLKKDNLFYKTNDPAAPFNIHNKEKDNKYKDIEFIKEILHNEKETIYNRYRALFTLREFNNERAVEILCECFNKELAGKFSPLLKHEISFILGQMCTVAKKALNMLEVVLQDESEDPIVRHETALALGEITKSKDLLVKYSKHENQLIRESCEIALDFVDYWQDGCC